MNAALVDFGTERLKRLESQALAHKAEAVHQWQLFVQKALEIADSKLWEADYPNWQSYCKTVFNLDSSRIRQMKIAIPYAELITEATDINPTESQVRNCRQAVGSDSLLLVPVFQAAVELAKGNMPQPRHFKAAYEVLKNAANTGAVTVGDLSMPANAESTPRALKEAFQEADMRYKQHIQEGSKSEKWRGTVKEWLECYYSYADLDTSIIVIIPTKD